MWLVVSCWWFLLFFFFFKAPSCPGVGWGVTWHPGLSWRWWWWWWGGQTSVSWSCITVCTFVNVHENTVDDASVVVVRFCRRKLFDILQGTAPRYCKNWSQICPSLSQTDLGSVFCSTGSTAGMLSSPVSARGCSVTLSNTKTGPFCTVCAWPPDGGPNIAVFLMGDISTACWPPSPPWC